MARPGAPSELGGVRVLDGWYSRVESNRLPDIAGIDPKFGQPAPNSIQVERDSNRESGLEFVRVPTPGRPASWPADRRSRWGLFDGGAWPRTVDPARRHRIGAYD